MSADRWQRLNDLFHDALRLPGDERATYIASACAGDDVLRAELEQLIDADEHAERFLGVNAFENLDAAGGPPVDAHAAGRRFGSYRVVAELGRGGMGAVFLADREDGQFEQRVAIKVIKRGMDTAMVLERFRVERQILSTLNHPNIARLLDGGTTGDGRPYFVMEHIGGLPIDAYADEQRLAVRERLELFLQVCDAVSYAHQRLIVHRDIKPQNILVTPEGVPKLLDFGIAKVLLDAGEQGTMTVAGHHLLTPDYASPEQVDGRHTTTQSDVYSLGVVLYELLTGRSPYRPRTWSAPDVCEAVRTSPVDRPSTAIVRPADDATCRRTRPLTGDRAAATGAGTLERLRLQLRGDLDAIVLAALRKEPERRYRSVDELAGDIRRHLEGQPVRARDDGVWYRAAKFVGRNRTGVAAAVLVALALVSGAVATAWQAREARVQARLAQQAQARAEQRFADVRKLANALLFDYHDAIKDLPGATEVRARLVRDALEYLNGLTADAGTDPSLQRELALAYRRVAQVQGGRTGPSLGDTTGALESHRKSLAILGALAAASPDDVRIRRELADGELQLAYLISETGDVSRALEHARRARRVYEPLLAGARPTPDERLEAANALDVNGTLLLETGRPQDALELHRRQLELLESAPESDRQDPRLRRALSVAYQHAADAEATFGDLEGALARMRRSTELRAALSAEFPLNVDYRRLLATSWYYEGATLLRLERPGDALQAFRHSLAIAEELAAADPKADSGDVAFGAVRVGETLARLGGHAQALGYYRRAQSLRAAQLKDDPANLLTRAALIEIEALTCAALLGVAEDAAASAACRRTVNLIEGTRIEPTNAWIWAAVARSYTAMADAYAARGGTAGPPERRRQAWREAQELYRRSVAIWADMRARSMLTSHDEEEAADVSASLAAADAAVRRLPPGLRPVTASPAANRR